MDKKIIIKQATSVLSNNGLKEPFKISQIYIRREDSEPVLKWDSTTTDEQMESDLINFATDKVKFSYENYASGPSGDPYEPTGQYLEIDCPTIKVDITDMSEDFAPIEEVSFDMEEGDEVVDIRVKRGSEYTDNKGRYIVEYNCEKIFLD